MIPCARLEESTVTLEPPPAQEVLWGEPELGPIERKLPPCPLQINISKPAIQRFQERVLPVAPRVAVELILWGLAIAGFEEGPVRRVLVAIDSPFPFTAVIACTKRKPYRS